VTLPTLKATVSPDIGFYVRVVEDQILPKKSGEAEPKIREIFVNLFLSKCGDRMIHFPFTSFKLIPAVSSLVTFDVSEDEDSVDTPAATAVEPGLMPASRP
jgi:hypothetical protein